MKNALLLVNQITPSHEFKFFASTAEHTGLLFCGAIGVLFFFILLIYFKTKERLYLYYCLFLLFNLVGGVINLEENTWISTWFQQSNRLAGASLETVTLLAFSCYCLFSIHLFDLKKINKNLYRWVLVLAYISAIYGLLYYFIRPYIIDYLTEFFIGSRSLFLVISIIVIVWKLKIIKSPIKNYYIIGTGWYFLGALTAVLRDTTSDLLFPAFYRFNSTVYFQSGIFLETLCFALALTYRIYLYYEERQQNQIKINTKAIYEKELAQAEALSLRMQINPHFLFNSLNVLNYYIQSAQNKKATNYLITFSQFIRTIIDMEQKPVISLEQELNIIKNYLSLEKARFDQTFSYKIKVHKEVDFENLKLPPMLLQPFVEEAIWNRLLTSKDVSPILTIDIWQNNTILYILIEDNGNNKKEASEKFHQAVSKQITEDRIALYNKNYNGQISYKTQNKNNFTGTQILITIKYSSKNMYYDK